MLYITTILVASILAVGDAIGPDYHVEALAERSVLGEGPYWDEGHQRLYWVDMRNMWINSYSPDTGDIFKAKLVTDKKPVSLVIRVKDTEDKFIISLQNSLALIKWDGKSNVDVKPMMFLDLEDPNGKTRCNDGKVDPFNRLWVETMGPQTKSDPKGNKFEKDKGVVYRIDHDGSKHKMCEKMQIPNGLEWSLDKDTFYLVDSLTFIVYEYKYNNEDGSIDRPTVRKLYDLKENGIVGGEDKPNSLPDGMTIDSEGKLWVAVYGTGKVIRIDPVSGLKIFEIQLENVLQPTSVCFGGKDLDVLFVTTARVDWTDDFEQKYPKSGHTFKITNLGVKGAAPSRPAKLPDSLVARVGKDQDITAKQ